MKGQKLLKTSKLQWLTSKFEEIMLEDKSFHEFYSNLNNTMNFKFNLSEKMKNSKDVRKIIRSFFERFHLNLITIEESKDLDKIKVEELVGSLKTYELSLLQTKRRKSIIKTMKEDYDDSSDEENCLNDEDYINDEDLYLIARKFRKLLLNTKANGKNKLGKEFLVQKNIFDKCNKNKSKRKKKYNVINAQVSIT